MTGGRGARQAELDALIAVSRAVAHAPTVEDALDEIARQAALLVGARAASIMLLRGDNEPLAVGGVFGLGPSYLAAMQNPTPNARAQVGPIMLAVGARRQVIVEDTERDPRYRSWRVVARIERYRSMLSTPLVGQDGRVLGTLDVFREVAGSWPERDCALLQLLTEHATSAIRVAKLLDRQREQLHALRRVVRTMKEQGHEHANRIHTVRGLLELGEADAALRFVTDLVTVRTRDQGFIAERIAEPVICALLTAQTAIAEQRGIKLQLTPRSRLAQLPPSMHEAEAVTVLGNLLDNALDAVSDAPPRRRRVGVSLTTRGRSSVWRVRDHGPGVPDELSEVIFRRGWSLKESHRGLGLFLVSDVVRRARGTIRIVRHQEGTTFVVTLPHADRAGAGGAAGY